MKILKETLDVIETKRKKNSFVHSVTHIFSKTDYNQYTDEEAHAEMGKREKESRERDILIRLFNRLIRLLRI